MKVIKSITVQNGRVVEVEAGEVCQSRYGWAVAVVIAVLAALLLFGRTHASDARYEQVCENGVCRLVLVGQTAEPPAARMPLGAGPSVAVPPAVVRFPRARATVQRILPLRVGLKRFLLLRLFR